MKKRHKWQLKEEPWRGSSRKRWWCEHCGMVKEQLYHRIWGWRWETGQNMVSSVTPVCGASSTEYPIAISKSRKP